MARRAWFRAVFGFDEGASYATNQSHFKMEGDVMVCGDRRFHVGSFETPSLQVLRERVREASPRSGEEGLSFTHMAAPTGVGPLHEDPANDGAVFQAASQFNCLEMVGPGVSPRRGITRYIDDNTQGPKCALACPAGTAYRNYRCLAGAGQGGAAQIDCLSGVGAIVGNAKDAIWTMSNGYSLPKTKKSMGKLGARLEADPTLVARAEEALRVGVQWDTEVECRSGHRVCQVYASAVPVAYTKSTPSVDWAPFARLVLRGAYDATLCVARCLAAQRPTGERVTVYLTSLGGGAFGNRSHWIGEAITAALEKHREAPLDVVLIHYGTRVPSGSWHASVASRFPERAARSGARCSGAAAAATAK